MDGMNNYIIQTYLGIILDHTLSFNERVQKSIASVKHKLFLLILTLIEYGSKQSLLTKQPTFQNKCLKAAHKLHALPARTPTADLNDLCGTATLEFKCS